MSLTYCFDTNIVINLHRNTPRDVWPTVWDRVEALITAGRAFLPRQVLIELDRVDDACGPWVRAFDGFVAEADYTEVQLVAAISTQHPDWVRQQINEADPWLIAHAAVQGRAIVSEERAKGAGTIDANLKIPNVAQEHGLACIDFNGLARREGWQF